MEAVLNAVFVVLLGMAAISDIRYGRIPDRLCAAIILLGILAIICVPEPGAVSRLGGFFAVSVPLLLITLCVPGAFGGGDVKLTAVCGLFLGTERMALAFMLAMAGSGIWGLGLWGRRLYEGNGFEKKVRFPIGPFLGLGMLIALVR